MEIILSPAIVFESGFSGLTITSLNGVVRLFINGASISCLFAAALRIGEKKDKK
ncbi:MAG: hypothetical protein KGQ86_09625 [Bacteroidetes bacterium]|nr:hypothetical protein [Bacteroidota bacterium]